MLIQLIQTILKTILEKLNSKKLKNFFTNKPLRTGSSSGHMDFETRFIFSNISIMAVNEPKLLKLAQFMLKKGYIW